MDKQRTRHRQRYRDWMVTSWQPVLELRKKYVRYVRAQREVSPKTKRLHWQGFLVLSKPMDLEVVKRKVLRDLKCHIERRMKSVKQCLEYCSKERTAVGKPLEWGTPPQQGKDADLLCVKEMAEKKIPRLQILNAYPATVMKHHRALEWVIGLTQTKRKRMTSLIWIHGPAGSGKTETAWALAGTEAYDKNPGNRWWDGYEQQKRVVIDNLDSGCIPYWYLNRLCDKTPFRVEIKCGTVEFDSKRVYVTSVSHPKDVYPNAWHTGELERRVSLFIELELTA